MDSNLYNLRGFLVTAIGVVGILAIEMTSLLMQPEPVANVVVAPLHGISVEGCAGLVGLITAYCGTSYLKRRAEVQAAAPAPSQP